MPLALSGFEAAIDAGKPFEAELAALATDLPGLVVPPELAQSATNGLPPPESVASGLSTAVPAMLAARPADHDASWQQRIADRAAAFLALRPSGDAEGDGPDAIIARIESAVARRDFIAADKNFSMLPEPMRAAAQNAGKDIAALAAAERFAARARTEALAPRTGTPQ